ncbi:MAG: ligase-associated DNA damage response exonuclease [Phycisphaerae bacterium]|nr:ligase-associated DNA damage response exonuclease [Phycisphaerae bacterium]
MIISEERGLYCPAGDFHIDAWKPVDRNIITHAHSDHARAGSKRNLAAADGEKLLRLRLGSDAVIDAIRYGETIEQRGVKISLHPAGHVLGSAQVRVEHEGRVCVVSGDYKRQADSTCALFEPIRCHEFITECTFGLPIYHWPAVERVAEEMNAWWRENASLGRTSILLGYSLGKSQRMMSLLDPTIGPILLHGSVLNLTQAYRDSGVRLPPAEHASVENAKLYRGKALVIAPPSVMQATWIRKFAPVSVAMASGWMMIRGNRRRRGVDRGFVLSDHVDFDDLLRTISETGAEHIIATHGYTTALTRLLGERGIHATSTRTEWVGDEDQAMVAEQDAMPEPAMFA